MMDIREVDSPTVNPYWDVVRTMGHDPVMSRGRWQPSGFGGEILMDPTLTGEERMTRFLTSPRREELVTRYAWAIPDPRTLEVLTPLAGRAVELGAGTGYWAWQLEQLGWEVDAYDINASARHHRGAYYDVKSGDVSAVEASTAETLVLCWAPYEDPMAAEAVRAFRGSRLLVVGEGPGGCTGDDGFFEQLARWECTLTHVPVQYSGIHDVVEVYER